MKNHCERKRFEEKKTMSVRRKTKVKGKKEEKKYIKERKT